MVEIGAVLPPIQMGCALRMVSPLPIITMIVIALTQCQRRVASRWRYTTAGAARDRGAARPLPSRYLTLRGAMALPLAVGPPKEHDRRRARHQ